MAWIAGVVSAAGSAASGALGSSGGGTEPPYFTNTGNALADPFISAYTMLSMAQMGLPIPDELIDMQSPLSAALANYQNSGSLTSERQLLSTRTVSRLQEYLAKPGVDIEALISGLSIPGGGEIFPGQQDFDRQLLLDIAGRSGVDLGTLIRRQVDFNVNRNALANSLAGLTSDNATIRDVSARNLAALAQNMPDVSAAAQAKMAEMQQQILEGDINRISDEMTQYATMQANYGNFNPGRIIGDIREEQQRQLIASPIEAINRATALLGGQQSLAGNAISLYQALLGQQQANSYQTAALRANALTGTATAGGATSYPGSLGQGISKAADTLASTILNQWGSNQQSTLDKYLEWQATQGSAGSPGYSPPSS